MGRLREINAKAQFAFAPTSTLIACGTAAGSLSSDLSDESRIEIYDLNLGNADPEAFTLKPENGVTVQSRCVDISWGAVSSDRPQGIIAAAMDDGSVDFWDPQAILSGSGEAAALINRGTAHTGTVKCIDFNTVQTNLLASAGTKGEFFVWDVSKPTTTPTAYKSTRLDEIVSLSWNKKVGHIIALGGRGGALSVWDLRKKSELLHIPTRYHISTISWHPTEPTLLMTGSGDDHNPVLQLWDLRNANAPKCTLSGHERGILSISWCASDPDLLLSSGTDNRTLIWNPLSATIVAELPASSQWVHRVSWCKTQPAIIANATLDGKITVYSVQDTSEQQSAPVIDGTPAGDDFFDSIPKNFQAQSTTFTLKQTPKWLKRPASAAFGYGGRLVYVTPGSSKVGIARQSLAGHAIDAAKTLKEDLSTKSIAELCRSAYERASENEKQDWDVIETLTAEHARDALLKYLGFTKEDVEKEVLQKLEKLDIATEPEPAEIDKEAIPKESAGPTVDRVEASVFGEDAGDDDFLGAINSEVPTPAEKKSNGTQTTEASARVSQGAFKIFDSAIAKPDELVTRAILTGQFDVAIDVCLSEDRLSDAFMLALCGGPQSQKKVQDAYFTRTKVPYGRLLSSIIAGDLQDIVQNANIAHWKEVLAILCNYAKPEDFSKLCEALGNRLEAEETNQEYATLCYLAGSKLEHLVRIWSSAQSHEEQALLSKETVLAPFEIHFTTLCKLMRKVSVFRKAVSYNDDQKMTGSTYDLAVLYDKYVEFAGILSSTGDSSLALEYLSLVPKSYDAVEPMRKRLAGPAVSAQTAQKTTGMRPTGMRNVYTQPSNAQQAPAANSAGVSTNYGRSVALPPTSETATKTSSRAAPAHNPYAAQTNDTAQKPATPFNPYAPQQANIASPTHVSQQQTYGQNLYGQQVQQQPNLNAFAPPPRINSAGPSILPAAQRKDITPWNDAPDVPLPAPRRPTPSTNRSAIASPFPNQPSPTLQAFGPSQAAALAPPPKSRSPAPPRAQPAASPSSNGPVQARTVSNPYAPMPQAAAVNAPAAIQAPTPSSASMYGPPSQALAQPAVQDPSRYNAPVAAPTAQLFAPPSQPPPSSVKQSFAPPPKAIGGPPRQAATKSQSPIIQSPTIGGGIALSREPSRQSSPAPAKPAVPAAIHPAGDRTHIDAADMVIPDQMTALLKHLQAISPEKYRRPLEDTSRRLNLLFDQLNNAQLAPATLSQVHLLNRALHASDWGRAYAIHMDLTANNMHEVRDWIVGIKTLIVIGKKSGEDHWQ